MTGSVSQSPNLRLLSAQEVSARLELIYGRDPADDTGVIHGAAVVRDADGLLHVLRIGPHAPKSQTDFFLLQALRARADVIVTSSANLRAEPDLHHGFQGPCAQGLSDYRRKRIEKLAPPELYILTQSGDLPPKHLTFGDATDKHVLVPKASAPRVHALGLSHLTIHEVAEVSVRTAVELAHSRGHRTVSIETGPRLVAACYGSDSLVDELCLATFVGERPGPLAIGGALPDDSLLFSGRSATGPGFAADDFVFQRYL